MSTQTTKKPDPDIAIQVSEGGTTVTFGEDFWEETLDQEGRSSFDTRVATVLLELGTALHYIQRCRTLTH